MKKLIAFIVIMATLQPSQVLFCGEAVDPALNPQAVPAIVANALAKPNNSPPVDLVAQAAAAQKANFEGGPVSSVISGPLSDLPPTYKRSLLQPSPIALAYAAELRAELSKYTDTGKGYEVTVFQTDSEYSNQSHAFYITQVYPTVRTFGSMSFTASVRPETGVTVDPMSVYIRYPIPATPPTTIPGGVTTKDMPVYRPPTPNGNPGEPVRPTFNDGLEGPITGGNTGAGGISGGNSSGQFQQILPKPKPIYELPIFPVEKYTPNWGPAFYKFAVTTSEIVGQAGRNPSILAIAALTKITIASVSPRYTATSNRFVNFIFSYGTDKPQKSKPARITVSSKRGGLF